MQDRSRLLVAVLLFALVVLLMDGFHPLHWLGHIAHGFSSAIPWILLGVGIYLLSQRGGCCARRRDAGHSG